VSERYQKLEIALRYFLKGAGFATALKALDFCLKWHKGLRKDGKTPESQHQIEIALYCITLKGLLNLEMVLVAALLHDVLEDYPEAEDDFIKIFGQGEIYYTCQRLNKNKAAKYVDYFGTIANDPVASIVKGADRVHNVNSMVGVFSKEKQARYAAEVEEHFLPMLKKARKNFPEQLDAYFNIMHMLRSQLNLLRGV
jgi:(p)ppGpp synthase/HD superfamily hydrolase